jgi:hypothetical protein
MPDNKKLKTATRARQTRTGETYSTARMHVLASVAAARPPVEETPPAFVAPDETAAAVSGPRTPRVFMCHATQDKPEVEWVANHILSLRPELEFWIDNWSMVPGDSIVRKIDEGLSAADRLVVFLTPSSVTSSWVRNELEAGSFWGSPRSTDSRGRTS